MPVARQGASPLPPGELLPHPKLLNHLPSEDLLRDLAQLPGCWGKGTGGPWVVQETGGFSRPQEDPWTLDPGHFTRRRRERHVDDTPTDPMDSERAETRHANLWVSLLGIRGQHTLTQVGTRFWRGALMRRV